MLALPCTSTSSQGLAHADAVLAREAEWLWQKVIEDAKAGKLGRQTSLTSRGIYKHLEWPTLENLPMPRRELMKSARYVPFDVVQKFCSVSTYNGTSFRFRPVKEVIAELETVTRDAWWLGQDHDTGAPFYQPKQLTRDELRTGWVKAWKKMYSYSSIMTRYDIGLAHSWIQDVAYWPLNMLMHALAERKIGKGDRTFRKHRAIEMPFGL
jgi:hypothetical protein